jgi:hypothetical protein
MTGSRKRRGSGGGSHRCRAAPADDNRAGSLSGGPARRRGTISEDDNATEGSPGVITTWTPTPRSYGRGSRCQAPSQRQRRSRSRSTPRPRRTAPTTDYIDRVDRSRRRVEQSAGSTHARAWIPSGALLPLVRVNVLTLYISLTVATTDLFVCAVHNLIAVIDTVCRDHPIYSHPTCTALRIWRRGRSTPSHLAMGSSQQQPPLGVVGEPAHARHHAVVSHAGHGLPTRRYDRCRRPSCSSCGRTATPVRSIRTPLGTRLG